MVTPFGVEDKDVGESLSTNQDSRKAKDDFTPVGRGVKHAGGGQ
jgi:hypothetical protein